MSCWLGKEKGLMLEGFRQRFSMQTALEQHGKRRIKVWMPGYP
jgi:hypothetical protein